MIENRVNINFGDLKINTNLSSYYSYQYLNETTTPLIVKNGKCYYISSNGYETEFQNIAEALYTLSDFNGTIKFESNLTENLQLSGDFFDTNLNSFYNTGGFLSSDLTTRFIFNNRNITFDLNSYEWIIDNNDIDRYDGLHYFMLLDNNSHITIKNGTLSCHNMMPVRIYGGNVIFENSKIHSNCRMDIRQKDGTQKSKITIDRNSELIFNYEWFKCSTANYDSQYSIGVFLYGAQMNTFKNLDGYTSIREYCKDFIDYMPTLIVEGKLIAHCQVPDKSFDATATNGELQRMPIRFVIGKNAYLYCEKGVTLFINNEGRLEINGGTIVGDTAIAMRCGTLLIPRYSNPTVIGMGYSKYDKSLPGGQGATLINKLGNAVAIEHVDGYGGNSVLTGDNGKPARVIIESGDFKSLKNVPIGSYSHLKAGSSTQFSERVEKFVYGGFLSKQVTTIPYDYETSENVDYNIIADGSREFQQCQIL